MTPSPFAGMAWTERHSMVSHTNRPDTFFVWGDGREDQVAGGCPLLAQVRTLLAPLARPPHFNLMSALLYFFCAAGVLTASAISLLLVARLLCAEHRGFCCRSR